MAQSDNHSTANPMSGDVMSDAWLVTTIHNLKQNVTNFNDCQNFTFTSHSQMEDRLPLCIASLLQGNYLLLIYNCSCFCPLSPKCVYSWSMKMMGYKSNSEDLKRHLPASAIH